MLLPLLLADPASAKAARRELSVVGVSSGEKNFVRPVITELNAVVVGALAGVLHRTLSSSHWPLFEVARSTASSSPSTRVAVEAASRAEKEDALLPDKWTGAAELASLRRCVRAVSCCPWLSFCAASSATMSTAPRKYPIMLLHSARGEWRVANGEWALKMAALGVAAVEVRWATRFAPRIFCMK